MSALVPGAFIMAGRLCLNELEVFTHTTKTEE